MARISAVTKVATRVRALVDRVVDAQYPMLGKKQLADARLLRDSSVWDDSVSEPALHPGGRAAGQIWSAFVRRHESEQNIPDSAREWERRSKARDPFWGYARYQDCRYEVRGTYTKEQARLLVLEAADWERRTWERLRAKFDRASGTSPGPGRPRIPEAVRVEVWRRDQGRCSHCGGRERLEFDHIVPVSKGGSNTARNIELLCETCNREKGDRIE